MKKKEIKDGVKIKEISNLIKGEILGNKDLSVFEIAPISNAKKTSLSMLLKRELKKNIYKIKKENAPVLLTDREVISKIPEELKKELTFIKVENPQKSLIKLLPTFFERSIPKRTISEKAEISKSAKIGQHVSIQAFSVIGENVEIEDDVTIYPHVTIYQNVKIKKGTTIHSNAVIREDCEIGAYSVIQNGAVIGADGFGYITDKEKGLIHFPQVGNVILKDMVDIGANACVDRAALGSTKIGTQTKIDNLVQVGHNTKIGNASILCGQVGVSGSCDIGNQVVLGGGVGIADHVTICDEVRLGARSGVVKDIKERGDYAGVPVEKSSRWIRIIKTLRKLPEIEKKIQKLKK